MSLPPPIPQTVPEETARVVRAVFPKGNNLYVKMHDELGTFFEDQQFAALFPVKGQPAEAPWRLALVTIFQFMENLSDRAAADAVRSRIDWKYALCLSLTDPGFDYSVLSKFRSRLPAGQAEQQLLDSLLQRFKEQGLLTARSKARTDSTHVLAAVHKFNRIAQLGETVRAALNDLAVVAPDWLRTIAPPQWYERYGKAFDDNKVPSIDDERKILAETIGQDGRLLLPTIYTSPSWQWLSKIPSIEVLRRSWVLQYYIEEEQIHLRELKDQPPASQRFESPYDPEATYATKRNWSWTGYKVQVTESCEEGQVHLITNIETTKAPVSDMLMIEPIHAKLADKELLPTTHLVDSGYVGTSQLIESQQKYEVELFGPIRQNSHWQARAGQGYAMADFKIDWEAEKVICPEGHTSHLWNEAVGEGGKPIIRIDFHQRNCQPCPKRALCTKAKNAPRELTLRPKEQHLVMEQRRAEQQTEEWKKRYQQRAGIEGTLSQGVRGFGLRNCRYIGLAKTRLQHLAIAAAINLERAINWLAGLEPAKTRVSRFAALALFP